MVKMSDTHVDPDSSTAGLTDAELTDSGQRHRLMDASRESDNPSSQHRNQYRSVLDPRNVEVGRIIQGRYCVIPISWVIVLTALILLVILNLKTTPSAIGTTPILSHTLVSAGHSSNINTTNNNDNNNITRNVIHTSNGNASSILRSPRGTTLSSSASRHSQLRIPRLTFSFSSPTPLAIVPTHPHSSPSTVDQPVLPSHPPASPAVRSVYVQSLPVHNTHSQSASLSQLIPPMSSTPLQRSVPSHPIRLPSLPPNLPTPTRFSPVYVFPNQSVASSTQQPKQIVYAGKPQPDRRNSPNQVDTHPPFPPQRQSSFSLLPFPLLPHLRNSTDSLFLSEYTKIKQIDPIFLEHKNESPPITNTLSEAKDIADQGKTMKEPGAFDQSRIQHEIRSTRHVQWRSTNPNQTKQPSQAGHEDSNIGAIGGNVCEMPMEHDRTSSLLTSTGGGSSYYNGRERLVKSLKEKGQEKKLPLTKGHNSVINHVNMSIRSSNSTHNTIKTTGNAPAAGMTPSTSSTPLSNTVSSRCSCNARWVVAATGLSKDMSMKTPLIQQIKKMKTWCAVVVQINQENFPPPSSSPPSTPTSSPSSEANVIYLSLSDQLLLPYTTAKLLASQPSFSSPSASSSSSSSTSSPSSATPHSLLVSPRKNLGYLYAINHGAAVIFDTDLSVEFTGKNGDGTDILNVNDFIPLEPKRPREFWHCLQHSNATTLNPYLPFARYVADNTSPSIAQSSWHSDYILAPRGMSRNQADAQRRKCGFTLNGDLRKDYKLIDNRYGESNLKNGYTGSVAGGKANQVVVGNENLAKEKYTTWAEESKQRLIHEIEWEQPGVHYPVVSSLIENKADVAYYVLEEEEKQVKEKIQFKSGVRSHEFVTHRVPFTDTPIPPPGTGRAAGGYYASEGVFVPFNSKATLFRYEALWSLLLPHLSAVNTSSSSTTTLPAESALFPQYLSDILRSYVTQALGFKHGMRFVTHEPWVKHAIRGEKTFIDSQKHHGGTISTLATEDKIIDALLKYLHDYTPSSGENAAPLPSQLVELYTHLYERGIVSALDVKLAQAWIVDLITSGFIFPTLNTNLYYYTTRQKLRGGTAILSNEQKRGSWLNWTLPIYVRSIPKHNNYPIVIFHGYGHSKLSTISTIDLAIKSRYLNLWFIPLYSLV